MNVLLVGTHVFWVRQHCRSIIIIFPPIFLKAACWGDKQWDRWRKMSLFHQSFYVHCEDSEQELDSITSATNVESSTKDSRNEVELHPLVIKKHNSIPLYFG